ncbi:hypothetical protein [Pseudonocardia acidicola]|uniref:Uncharacterized protein n=1 Tax=Pseudonocardia acidicola TaxID=2724939 RepID=A0ABX1SG58_9PSEU|nr:hypothetical protein [Pseudonocardia acidicola]NMI00542.1 hypothetical protein [Pseudonocardia acidicola]
MTDDTDHARLAADHLSAEPRSSAARRSGSDVTTTLGGELVLHRLWMELPRAR